MLAFITDCAGLFTDTFDAAMGQEIFLILGTFSFVKVCFSLFFMLHRGAQKM